MNAGILLSVILLIIVIIGVGLWLLIVYLRTREIEIEPTTSLAFNFCDIASKYRVFIEKDVKYKKGRYKILAEPKDFILGKNKTPPPEEVLIIKNRIAFPSEGIKKRQIVWYLPYNLDEVTRYKDNDKIFEFMKSMILNTQKEDKLLLSISESNDAVVSLIKKFKGGEMSGELVEMFEKVAEELTNLRLEKEKHKEEIK